MVSNIRHTPLKRKAVRVQYQDWCFVDADESDAFLGLPLQQEDYDTSNHEKKCLKRREKEGRKCCCGEQIVVVEGWLFGAIVGT
jgi:hypothetical protein